MLHILFIDDNVPGQPTSKVTDTNKRRYQFVIKFKFKRDCSVRSIQSLHRHSLQHIQDDDATH